jgi:DNA damage-binding protein 1
VLRQGFIRGVGGLEHAQWRAFSNERRTEEARGFIDGDLVEQLLDLPPERQAQVAAAMGEGVTLEELIRRVEELSRLH